MADVDTPVTNGEKETRAKDTINTPEDVSEEDKQYLEVYRDILRCVKFLFHSSSRTEDQDENSATPSEDPSLEPQSKTELSKVLQQITSLVNHEKPTTQFTCSPDHYTHTSVIGRTLSLYLSLLDESCIKKLSACIKSDCSHWLSKLFSYENALSCFHEHQWQGLVKVCRLALRVKYPKFATEGFTALYTRPPVVYVSSSACNALGYYLCTQLGLPQSSICKVPCNTVFGSPHTMDIAAFERLFNDDISCGKTPLLLVAHAGTPGAGHTDNLSRLRELCTQNGLWLHIEGDTLATLCLETVPSSLKSAPASDSMTLSINKWFSLPSAPYCTFYRAKDLDLVEASGVNQSHNPDQLSVLPLWISIQTIGLNKMREMIMHAAQLSQQLCISLDGMQATVNRITQPHCMSPVVVFKYKASPILVNGKRIQEETEESASDQEEDQDDVELSSSSASSLPESGSIPSSSRDVLNRMIAKHLAHEVPSVNIDIVELPKEGCCIRFNPLRSARVCGTTSENIEDFVICLKEEVARLDARILSQAAFTLAAEGKEHLVAIEAQDTSSIGALLCIPRYWTNKDVDNLREAKKVELNEWNKEVLAKVSEEMADVFSRGRTGEGLTCIIINMLPPTSSVEGVVDFVCQAATELESSSKYLEQMVDAIQKGIEAAENDLVKDAEEKLMEEGLLRQVPLVGSFVNWLSPLPEEPKTMGRTFNLTSGHLHTTEKIYKYHMQVQDEDEEEDGVAVTPTKLSPTKTEPSPSKDGIED